MLSPKQGAWDLGPTQATSVCSNSSTARLMAPGLGSGWFLQNNARVVTCIMLVFKGEMSGFTLTGHLHISFGMKRVGIKDSFIWGAMSGATRISSWDSVYSESRSLLGRLRSTRLKAMPMLQHCGWGMYLAKLMKEMRDLGFLRHVAYPTVLLFCFLKAFIKNHESKIWFRFSPTKRFFAPEV